VRYSILRYGRPLLTDIESLEEAKKEALNFVSSIQSEYIEVQNSDNETVTIGYFDGRQFHWAKDKDQTDAWKSIMLATKPPLWRGPRHQNG
jgi:hypothetical protein